MQRLGQFLQHVFPLPSIADEGTYDRETDDVVQKPLPRINQISKLTKLGKWEDSTVVVVGFGHNPTPGVFPNLDVLQISGGYYHTAILTRTFVPPRRVARVRRPWLVAVCTVCACVARVPGRWR